MKNTDRVHRKNGKKGPSSQAQMEPPTQESVAVILVNHQTEETVSPGIDLTGADFAAIKKDAAARGESLDAWLVRTFNKTLRSLHGALKESAADSDMLKNEKTVLGSNLDEALQRVAGCWSAARRRAEARKLRRWATQLCASAIQLDEVEKLAADDDPIHN